MMGDGKSMYCAIPTRLQHLKEEFRKAARADGFAPTIPHDLGPFEDFEGNPNFGRERTLALMNRVMACYDAVGIFGISAGVLGELDFALALRRMGIEKEIRTYPGFDPEWDTEYARLAFQYGSPLERVRGKNTLVILVGGRAVGKTFWSDETRRLLEFKKVKNTTTRLPRSNDDHESYHFLSREEFAEKEERGEFLETAEYRGERYGSSLSEIKQILHTHNGIMALTPEGAAKIHRYRYEVNLKFFLLKADEDFLRKNLEKRGITTHSEIGAAIHDSQNFALPVEIPHTIFRLTFDASENQKLLELFRPA